MAKPENTTVAKEMVGLGGLEPPTSPLSVAALAFAIECDD
jgi:hypothetical protein